MIKNIVYVDNELTDTLGELHVELNNSEKYHIVYYVDKNDEFHFFYENGEKPNCENFERELIHKLS